MFVVFNLNYNGCTVYEGDEDEENIALSERIIDLCSDLYDEDGDFVGSESELIDNIKSVVGECEIEIDRFGS